MPADSFTIRISLEDGDPEDLRLVAVKSLLWRGDARDTDRRAAATAGSPPLQARRLVKRHRREGDEGRSAVGHENNTGPRCADGDTRIGDPPLNRSPPETRP